MSVPMSGFQTYDQCMMHLRFLKFWPNWRSLWAMNIALSALTISPAQAHVSEQGLVMLLPTQFYIGTGVTAVILTVLLVAFLKQSHIEKLFSHKELTFFKFPDIEIATSLATLGALIFLLAVGFWGPHDPLANILPMFILNLWWIGFVILQALLGDMWKLFNPWTGIYRLLRGSIEAPGFLTLPDRAGSWPGILGFVVFGAYALADISPSDPVRLATFISIYFVYTLVAMFLFGAASWLERGECMTILLRNYARLSAFQFSNGTLRIGVPGWQLVHMPTPSISASIFIIMILATGTFDGLNETFWWLGQIGINPLEFPGRSAVIATTFWGLIAANILLPVLFAVFVKLGLMMAGSTISLAPAFSRLAVAVLPIALAYHFAHYLPSLLVNAQYSLAAASDVWATGADYLNLGVFYVTTGFFNSHDTVKIIWLSEAGAVVVGHILAIVISHAMALELLPTERKAVLSQIPPAIFMVLYTLFGLWLLASPRGL